MNLINVAKRFRDLHNNLVRFDFSKIRDLVVLAIEEVMADGYDTFVGQVVIDHSEAQKYKLSIDIFARNSDGTNTDYSATQDFYSFSNMPDFIIDSLIYNHRFEVVLDMDDVRTIYQDRIKPINTSNKDFRDFVKSQLHKMGIRGCDVNVDILDIGLYYRAEVFETSNVSTPLTTILTLPINGLDSDDSKRLSSVHNVQIQISAV